jgi:hypothetical protein
MWVGTTSDNGTKNKLILRRSDDLDIKLKQIDAKVHFISDSKNIVLVTLQTPEVMHSVKN